ncbi:MAG: cold shock domain-containing protein [Acidobacteria bacterium]|nr:cold shock domain-containing protein [Acidobacteriota bacterium]
MYDGILYGSITRLEPGHGFGFIKDDGGMDWFFVREDVRGERFENIWIGERVGFVIEKTKSGPRAADVHHEQVD